MAARLRQHERRESENVTTHDRRDIIRSYSAAQEKTAPRGGRRRQDAQQVIRSHWPKGSGQWGCYKRRKWHTGGPCQIESARRPHRIRDHWVEPMRDRIWPPAQKPHVDRGVV